MDITSRIGFFKADRLKVSHVDYDRIMENVVKNKNGCWLYLGQQNEGGYGIISLDGDKWLTHRLMFAIHVRKPKTGMMVCHICDVPNCINPAHLYEGTAKDNALDKQQRPKPNAKPGGRKPSIDTPELKVLRAEIKDMRKLLKAIKTGTKF